MEGKYGIYVEHGTWGGYSNGWNGFANYYTPLWQPVNLPLPNFPTKTFLQTFGSGMNTVLDASMSSTGRSEGIKQGPAHWQHNLSAGWSQRLLRNLPSDKSRIVDAG